MQSSFYQKKINKTQTGNNKEVANTTQQKFPQIKQKNENESNVNNKQSAGVTKKRSQTQNQNYKQDNENEDKDQVKKGLLPEIAKSTNFKIQPIIQIPSQQNSENIHNMQLNLAQSKIQSERNYKELTNQSQSSELYSQQTAREKQIIPSKNSEQTVVSTEKENIKNTSPMKQQNKLEQNSKQECQNPQKEREQQPKQNNFLNNGNNHNSNNNNNLNKTLYKNQNKQEIKTIQLRNKSLICDKKLIETFDDFTKDNVEQLFSEKIIQNSIQVKFNEFTLKLSNNENDINRLNSVLLFNTGNNNNNNNSKIQDQKQLIKVQVQNQKKEEEQKQGKKQQINDKNKKKKEKNSSGSESGSDSEKKSQSSSESSDSDSDDDAKGKPNQQNNKRFSSEIISQIPVEYLSQKLFNSKIYGFENIHIKIRNNNSLQTQFHDKNQEQTVVEFQATSSSAVSNERLLQVIDCEVQTLQNSQNFQEEIFDLHLMQHFFQNTPNKKLLPGLENDENMRLYYWEEGQIMSIKNNYTSLEQIIIKKQLPFKESQLIIMIKQIFQSYHNLLNQGFFFNNFSSNNIIFCHKDQVFKLIKFSKIIKIQNDPNSFYKISTQNINPLFTPNDIISQMVNNKNQFIIINESYVKAYENYALGVCLIQLKYLLHDEQSTTQKLKQYNNFELEDKSEKSSQIIFNLVQNNPVSRACLNYKAALFHIENLLQQFQQANIMQHFKNINKHAKLNLKEGKNNSLNFNPLQSSTNLKSLNNNISNTLSTSKDMLSSQTLIKGEKQSDIKLLFKHIINQTSPFNTEEQSLEATNLLYNDLIILFRFKQYNKCITLSKQLLSERFLISPPQNSKNETLELISQIKPEINWILYVCQLNNKKYQECLTIFEENVQFWDQYQQINGYYNICLTMYYTENSLLSETIEKFTVILQQQKLSQNQKFKNNIEFIEMQIKLIQIFLKIQENKCQEAENGYKSLLKQIEQYYEQNKAWLRQIRQHIYFNIALCQAKQMYTQTNNGQTIQLQNINQVVNHLNQALNHETSNNNQIQFNLAKAYAIQNQYSTSFSILNKIKNKFDSNHLQLQTIQQFIQSAEFFLCLAEINFILKNQIETLEYATKCYKILKHHKLFIELVIYYQRITTKKYGEPYSQRSSNFYQKKYFLMNYQLAILYSELEKYNFTNQILLFIEKDSNCPDFIKENNNLQKKIEIIKPFLVEENHD